VNIVKKKLLAKLYKSLVRKNYKQIICYDVSCGHELLKTVNPAPYVRMSRNWDRLAELDPSCPDKPKWLD
jgi:hypothetical protein